MATLSQAVAGAWLRLWETMVSCIPLPRGLADFAVALALSLVLVLVYRCNKRLCWAVMLALFGALVISALAYYTAPF